MALQVMWATVCVTDPDSEQDEYFQRGQTLPDYVDEFTTFVLTTSGAAQVVDDPTEPEDEREPVRLQEHPPPALPQPVGELQMPAPTANKDAWVLYAIDVRNPKRMTRGEANAMSKNALVDKFTEKETGKSPEK